MASQFVGGILSFLKADPLNIFMVILLLPLIQEGFLSVTHEVLVNRLVKLAQEKVWLGEMTFST